MMYRVTVIILSLLLISCQQLQSTSVESNSATLAHDDAATIRQKAHEIAAYNQTRLSYDDIWEVLSESNEDPENPQNIVLFYTQWSIPKDHRASRNNQNKKDYWNREHLWPQSHAIRNTAARTDAHLLVPADKTVNESRGSLDFDNGGFEHHECQNCLADDDSWEPPDAVKGDLARILFYVDVRYEGNDSSGAPDLRLVEGAGKMDTEMGFLSALKQWHCQDPVSDFERRRNNIIETWQGNRNPFIDFPKYAELLYRFSCPDTDG